MLRALLCLLLALFGTDGVVAQRTVKQKPAERERLSPILDLLPAGSTIKKVRIPRFDKEKRRAALLRASVIKVVSEDEVSAENIELRLFSKKGPESVRMIMGEADFSRLSGVLTAKAEIRVSAEKIKAHGRDGLFHLDSRQGFVRGPVTTTFLRPSDKEEEKKKEGGENEGAEPNEDQEKQADDPVPTPVPDPGPGPVLPATAPDPTLIDITPRFLEPQALTISEREEMNVLLESRSKSVLADRAPTRSFMTRSEQLSQAAEVSFRSFTNRVNKKKLLAPVSTRKGPAPLPRPAKFGKHEIKVTCEGGMYLDPEQGHISYLRNIEVTEARFRMSCSRALKAFFDPVDTKGESGTNDEKNKERGGEADEPIDKNGKKSLEKAEVTDGLDFNPGDFTELKMIVASGGVRVIREDPQGKRPPIIATAERAIVNVETGDMVLQGGSPSISQGVNVLRADEPDLYLRYYANGNIFAEKGRWTTVGDLTSLQQEEENKKKKKAKKEDEDEDEENPAPAQEDAEKKAQDQEKGKEKKLRTITVTCTGGIYFDAKDGHIVYLDDVTVSDPRFSMHASDELKVFLRRRPDAEEEELEGPEAFSDVDHVVASGKVTVVRNDPGGKREPVTATAAHAVFDVETTDVFLQGGTPTIQQGPNYLKAGAPHLYLRFYQNGSLYAEPGPWTTVGDLANLRTSKDGQKKPANIVKITCKGGLFFDSLKGHIVYLDRIVVLESRFAMNCKGSLRIHLQERENAKEDRLEGPEAFSDVNVIVATGGVTVARKDPDGKAPVTASAETATYEAKTGDIGLRRGYPIIRRGNSYLKALEEGLGIAFYADGRFYAEKGKWETVVRDSDFEKLRDKNKKRN